jgi:methylase of polypeptide subunit release factors
MTEHSIKISQQVGLKTHRHLLESYVSRRVQGEPLQYILESQFFGAIEIRCRPGVLIPRDETAASVTHLVKTLSIEQDSSSALRVLDLCTGTGCIPLLFHHEFYSERPGTNTALECVGIDISGAALSIARENLIHRIADQSNVGDDSIVRRRSLQRIGFVQADVLKTTTNGTASDPPPIMEALERLQLDDGRDDFDILIANPPYISPREFQRTTSRSVRMFEPPLALVPSSLPTMSDVDIGDRFYPRLLELALQVNVKVVLFEVADMAQAQRVASLMINQGVWDEIEIWRDEPGEGSLPDENLRLGDAGVKVRGLGNGRSVFARRRRSPRSPEAVTVHEQ